MSYPEACKNQHIEDEINQGRLNHAVAKSQYRQMLAMETIAECLLKLANLPQMVKLTPENSLDQVLPGPLQYAPMEPVANTVFDLPTAEETAHAVAAQVYPSILPRRKRT